MSASAAAPAFPQQLTVDREFIGSEGMSLRQYFAAHAPAEPPLWFEPRMPTPRPELPAFAVPDLPLEVCNSINNHFWDAPYDAEIQEVWLERLKHRDWWFPRAESDVRSWLETRVAWKQAVLAFDDAYARERVVQWPWAWADAVLERGERS